MTLLQKIEGLLERVENVLHKQVPAVDAQAAAQVTPATQVAETVAAPVVEAAVAVVAAVEATVAPAPTGTVAS